jgi:hypothetical protein
MLPGSLVYASAGNGLGTIMAMGEQPGFDVMLEPTVLGPLIALAVLALLPVVYKRLKRRSVAR